MKNSIWPVVLIIIGAILLLNGFFPSGIGRILVPVALIWFGVRMYNRSGSDEDTEEYQASGDGDASEDQGGEWKFSGITDREDNHKKDKRAYNFVFSSNRIDLTNENLLPRNIEINSVFSSTKVRLPVDYNITVEASGAFCSIDMPDKQNIVLGETAGKYGSNDPAAPVIRVKLNCVFGAIKCTVG